MPGLDASTLSGAAWCGTDGYFDQPQAVVEAFGEAACSPGADLTVAEVEELAAGRRRLARPARRR